MRVLAAITVTVALLAGCTPQPPPAEPSVPYRASGNEPFWRVAVADGRIVLDRPGEPAREAATLPRQTIPSGYRYEAVGIVIDIIPQRCENSMSGALFADRVTVTLDGQRLEGCGGIRLPPARLEGTQWIVVALDGATVTLAPPPTLDIDEQGRVSGSDGCNRFVGGLVFDASGTAKADGMGAGTMMACPDEQTSVSQAYGAMRASVTAWHFEEDILVLSTADEKTIRLRQTF